MAEQRTSIEVKTSGPSYLAWRGKLLAELAPARVPGLSVHELGSNGLADRGFDFLVAAEPGVCFFVVVRAFSSTRLRLDHVAAILELRLTVDTTLIRKAHESRSPVVPFLFDADTDHGRFLRLDTLATSGTRKATLRLAAGQAISRGGIDDLVQGLRHAVTA